MVVPVSVTSIMQSEFSGGFASVAPKDRKIFAFGLSPFLHQGVTIMGSALPKRFLYCGCVFQVFGGYVKIFGADSEVFALTPNGFHELAHRGVFANAFWHGYDELDFSVFQVLQDFYVCPVFFNPIFPRDAKVL